MRITKANFFKLTPIPLFDSVFALLKATLAGSHARLANPLLPTRKR